jgi:peroxiredoxin
MVPRMSDEHKGRGEEQANILPAGTSAPGFTLRVTPDQTLSLADLAGNPVILAFYPADWSRSAATRWRSTMRCFTSSTSTMRNWSGSRSMGLGVQAFARDRRLHFPLLADFEPNGAVAKAYGVYRDHEGAAERALFVIDRQGMIFWSYLSPIAVNPGADGILDALERLSEGSDANEHIEGASHAA